MRLLDSTNNQEVHSLIATKHWPLERTIVLWFFESVKSFAKVDAHWKVNHLEKGQKRSFCVLPKCANKKTYRICISYVYELIWHGFQCDLPGYILYIYLNAITPKTVPYKLLWTPKSPPFTHGLGGLRYPLTNNTGPRGQPAPMQRRALKGASAYVCWMATKTSKASFDFSREKWMKDRKESNDPIPNKNLASIEHISKIGIPMINRVISQKHHNRTLKNHVCFCDFMPPNHESSYERRPIVAPKRLP